MRILDPRPELGDDSHRWEKLLTLAYALPEETMENSLYGALLGLRCMGAKILPINGGLMITHGEMDPDSYRRDRETYLMPHKADLARLMGELGEG